MIARGEDQQRLQAAIRRSPIVLVTGPRQVGKSTLARSVVNPLPENFFDLEDSRDEARLREPISTLSELQGTVVIDEAQRRQDLFPALRVIADKDTRPGRFLVLGSASPELVGLASESLAGRAALIELGGFRLSDLGTEHINKLWERGGLPRSVLANDDQLSCDWRDDYIRTFLERDLANLGIRIPATTMRRFWTMIAHYHGQTWNGAELSRAQGVSQTTVSRYLDSLTDALVVRQLQPWFVNTTKRQIKSPKIYIRDSGLLHRLLGIRNRHDLLGHPKIGASWEGFIIEQILMLDVENPWFWGTHSGAELDLLISIGPKRIGIEIKLTGAPSVTPSMRHALQDLELDRLIVVHNGEHRFAMGNKIDAIPATQLLTNPAVID